MNKMRVLKTFRIAGLLWGVTLFLFGLSVVADRMFMGVSGTILSADIVHTEKGKLGNPHRYYTKYILSNTSNANSSEYRAKGSDQNLSRKLKAGDIVVKRKWELDYSVNGEQVMDFPKGFYLAILVSGLACMLIGVFSHFQIKRR